MNIEHGTKLNYKKISNPTQLDLRFCPLTEDLHDLGTLPFHVRGFLHIIDCSKNKIRCLVRNKVKNFNG